MNGALNTVVMIVSVKYNLLTDNELINFLKKSDQAAYTEIYNRYSPLLIAFAFKKLRDEELTKDVVQDLLVKLWIKRTELNITSNLPGYLTTSLKNMIFNIFEKNKVALKYTVSLVDYSNSGKIAHTDYLIREKEWKKLIDAAIASLPKKMRQAFILNRNEQLTYAETAKKLNTTENNIQKHINAAIRILRTKLTLLF